MQKYPLREEGLSEALAPLSANAEREGSRARTAPRLENFRHDRPRGFAQFCPQIRPRAHAWMSGTLAVGDNLPRSYRNHTLESPPCPLNPLLLHRPYRFFVFRKSVRSPASDAP